MHTYAPLQLMFLELLLSVLLNTWHDTFFQLKCVKFNAYSLLVLWSVGGLMAMTEIDIGGDVILPFILRNGLLIVLKWLVQSFCH